MCKKQTLKEKETNKRFLLSVVKKNTIKLHFGVRVPRERELRGKGLDVGERGHGPRFGGRITMLQSSVVLRPPSKSSRKKKRERERIRK